MARRSTYSDIDVRTDLYVSELILYSKNQSNLIAVLVQNIQISNRKFVSVKSIRIVLRVTQKHTSEI